MEGYIDFKGTKTYENVRSILHTVLILNLFYWVISGWINVVSFAFNAGVPVVFSLSMFLMQDHNTTEYIVFLRILIRFKLFWCCCCCGRMVGEQYQFLATEKVNEGELAHRDTIGVTYDTGNHSIDIEQRAYRTGMECSLETRTVQCIVAENS